MENVTPRIKYFSFCFPSIKENLKSVLMQHEIKTDSSMGQNISCSVVLLAHWLTPLKSAGYWIILWISTSRFFCQESKHVCCSWKCSGWMFSFTRCTCVRVCSLTLWCVNCLCHNFLEANITHSFVLGWFTCITACEPNISIQRVCIMTVLWWSVLYTTVHHVKSVCVSLIQKAAIK